MGATMWDKEVADAYDATSAAMFAPAVLDPTVDLLARLAQGGRALEFAIGTGRVGVPLSQRGIEVHGIELSPYMAERLRAKPEADAITVTVGDMTSTRVPGEFSLVYVVWNAINLVTTQEEQTAVFSNAAGHLRSGGRFVVEVVVPPLQRMSTGTRARVLLDEPDHVAIDTLDDLVGQVASSHHWMAVDGRLIHHAAPYRYVWPSELDLMARIAGLELESRHSDWSGSSFTAESENQVVVFNRPTRVSR
jgi:SAM-dependent methyltransferase